ncbi:hypothetical protein CDN93_00520 [Escherichia coli]|jgi:hypothetical protein|uniref:Uncharacterized protein n=1 Tax=Escherichia coli TaxID=562 RepID=A0A787LT63_ECOLX|nr:hypothetical protein [Escherichia coli]EGZ4407326.1 hypothetical protein [Salmonella enterica subsp. enterica serovar Poona]MBD7608114.1 hypothetical protein [Klebsiella pneumoniae]DAH04489.1 MAG TPA: hypothetical protein [Caudoviricetes sp.]HEO9925271.1 hypothetical protein [Klebsiella pneumoniae subsp. pneumoniae]EAB9602502.1 hypothetical protein [Escherichia coli]
MSECNFNLAQLDTLSQFDPELSGFLKRKFAASHDDFVKQLYVDLDDAMYVLETQKHMYQTQQWGEDELTSVIIAFLKGRNYDAEHDTQHGGHIDILVKHQLGRFAWIGEAKLWKGPAYILGGWNQLNERYGTGTARDNHGGIIIYCKIKKSGERLDDWRKHLQQEVADAKITTDEDNPLRFMSTTLHPATNQPYYVRHMVVSLFHATGDSE